jgi:hypothetical protein
MSRKLSSVSVILLLCLLATFLETRLACAAETHHLMPLLRVAHWESGFLGSDGHTFAGAPSSLFFGRGNGRTGYAKDRDVQLTPGDRWRLPVLLTVPPRIPRRLRLPGSAAPQSSIKGYLPAVTIPANARFSVFVGMAAVAKRGSDGVTFYVYANFADGTRQRLLYHPTGWTGGLEEISADLGSISGKSVVLEFRVDSGPDSKRDQAVWYMPRIFEDPAHGDLGRFGHGSMRGAGKLAQGDRPLAVILMEYASRTPQFPRCQRAKQFICIADTDCECSAPDDCMDPRPDIGPCRDDLRSAPAPAIPPAVVTQLRGFVQGTDTFNLPAYFREVSGGRFTFLPATSRSGTQGVFGPYSIRGKFGDLPPGSTEAETLKWRSDYLGAALKEARSEDSLYLEDFDRDGNGTVDQTELTIIVLANGPAESWTWPGPSMGSSSVNLNSPLRSLNGRYSNLREYMAISRTAQVPARRDVPAYVPMPREKESVTFGGFATDRLTLLHELVHSLGGVDLYGGTARSDLVADAVGAGAGFFSGTGIVDPTAAPPFLAGSGTWGSRPDCPGTPAVGCAQVAASGVSLEPTPVPTPAATPAATPSATPSATPAATETPVPMLRMAPPAHTNGLAMVVLPARDLPPEPIFEASVGFLRGPSPSPSVPPEVTFVVDVMSTEGSVLDSLILRKAYTEGLARISGNGGKLTGAGDRRGHLRLSVLGPTGAPWNQAVWVRPTIRGGSPPDSATLMGATLKRPFTFAGFAHPDPAHLLNLGWVDPRTVSVEELMNTSAQSPATFELEAVISEQGGNLSRRPVLIHDSQPGDDPERFYLVEMRSTLARYDNRLSLSDSASGFCPDSTPCSKGDPTACSSGSCDDPTGGIFVWSVNPKPSGSIPYRGTAVLQGPMTLDPAEYLHPLDPPIEIRFTEDGPSVMVATRSADLAAGRAILAIWREE